ncbi:MAG: XRE family transcriptional regulator [Kiloniellales bacterium]|nr:XRE family transcriptional regulator [Kiloniellales bacterium]
MNKTHFGSSFDSFLEEEGTLEETTEVAIKRVLAWQIAEAMKQRDLTKTEMAKRMKTSRSQLDRLLDPQQTHVKLHTMQRAAAVVGKRLQIELVDERTRG